jgi:hypothetical protein
VTDRGRQTHAQGRGYACRGPVVGQMARELCG